MGTKTMWSPDPAYVATTAMQRFMKRSDCEDYAALHAWSIRDPDAFWRSLLQFCQLKYEGSEGPVRTSDRMPDVEFFPQLRLNFAENLLRFNDDAVALVSRGETRERRTTTYRELHSQVGRLSTALKRLGIGPGDRVAGFLPNIEESVIAMLAASSLGAIWSSCSPDFGTRGVVDRFGQIKPKVLFGIAGYRYNGKVHSCVDKLRDTLQKIPQIQHFVLIPYAQDQPCNAAALGIAEERFVSYDKLVDIERHEPRKPEFATLPFNHPLYIMYSSGTTGVPKCIVHGAGGTLLQHAKEHILHTDLRREDNIFYFTTCGWMMWNWLVSSLFVGSTITLFDGSPTYDGLDTLWRMAAEEGITHFGTSPKFIGTCRGQALNLSKLDLGRLRVILSTGAPLLAEDFDWVYDAVKADLQLSSISGGTDIISCFMLGNPVLPVSRGEIQCLGLGMDVVALADDHRPVLQAKGELACRTPFCSMPLGFWNDEDGKKFRAAYFHTLASTWMHGDYIEITQRHGAASGVVVYGRSDATLNPGGVRIGTAEIYGVVENLPEVSDSIAVAQDDGQGDTRIILFVVLAVDTPWDEALAKHIKDAIRAGTTPRHVPAIVLPVAGIPYTISGKKVEIAVTKIIRGETPGNTAALANPESLDNFRNLGALRT